MVLAKSIFCCYSPHICIVSQADQSTALKKASQKCCPSSSVSLGDYPVYLLGCASPTELHCSLLHPSTALGTKDAGAKGPSGSLVHTILQDKREQKAGSLGISKRGEEKVETSFFKKAPKLRHCFAVSSSFYLVKLYQSNKISCSSPFASREKRDMQNWERPPGLMTLGTPVSAGRLHLSDPFLKFMRFFFLKAKYVWWGFFGLKPYKEVRAPAQ